MGILISFGQLMLKSDRKLRGEEKHQQQCNIYFLQYLGMTATVRLRQKRMCLWQICLSYGFKAEKLGLSIVETNFNTDS